jgi:hypothetical protein
VEHERRERNAKEAKEGDGGEGIFPLISTNLGEFLLGGVGRVSYPPGLRR